MTEEQEHDGGGGYMSGEADEWAGSGAAGEKAGWRVSWETGR